MIIYCYTNKVNGKQYIGQTMNPKQRMSGHKSSAFNEKSSDYNTPFHRALRKYGLENFDYQVIDSSDSLDMINYLEEYYIKLYNTQVPNGYNIKPGGENHSYQMSEETKIKLMESHASLTEDEVIELRKAYQDKKSPKAIYNEKYADRLGYPAFMNIWTGQRYKSIMPEVFCVKNRHTKLNEDIVRQIRLDRRDLNLSYNALATKYNVSKSTIVDICNGKTWKQVQI